MNSDPNKDRNDTMVPEYWTLGEDFQAAIQDAGVAEADGLAVDIHDILQASDVIREALESGKTLEEQRQVLRFEMEHIKWHCERAMEAIGTSENPAPAKLEA